MIGTLHEEEIVNQHIVPSNFVCIEASDEVLKPIRILDMGSSVRVGQPCKKGTRFFNPPESFEPDFKASPYQDTFAFAITIILLEDKQNYIAKDLNKGCPDIDNTFAEECKKKYGEVIQKIVDGSDIEDLLVFLKDNLFNSKTLTIRAITQQINELVEELGSEERRNLI